MKSCIPPSVAKFACLNLAVKFSIAIFLNSGVVIDLLWSGILFSTAVKAVVVVAKLVKLGILFLTSFILALRIVLVAKLVISSIFYFKIKIKKKIIFNIFDLSIIYIFFNKTVFSCIT